MKSQSTDQPHESKPDSQACPTTPTATNIQDWMVTKLAEAIEVEPDDIDIHRRFTEFGIESIVLFTLTGDLSEWLERDLPAELFWEHRTIDEVANRLAEVLAVESSSAEPVLQSPPLAPASRDQDLVLSFGQERQWCLAELFPDSSAVNIYASKSLEGPLDVPTLEESFAKVVKRHESLRTTFRSNELEPVQVIHPTCDVRIPVDDLQQVAEGNREEECRRMAGKHLRRRFDLEHGPLIRLNLLRLDKEKHVLLVVMHHIISDGWSFGIFFDELSANYDAAIHGLPAPLPELKVQYADYARWQRDWLQGHILEEQLAYWREKLSDSETLQLPTDKPRPYTFEYEGAHLPFRISGRLVQGLKELSKEEDVSQFATFATLFNVLLHRYSGQDDISLGTFVSNRSQPETKNLIGFFVNNLVLRNDLSGDPTFRETIHRVRRDATDALANQDIPFETLLEKLGPSRDGFSNPLFQVMLAFHNFPIPPLQFSGLNVTDYAVPRIARPYFELSLWTWEEGDNWSCFFEYAKNLFNEETIRGMQADLQALLEAVIEHPDQPISSYNLPAGPTQC